MAHALDQDQLGAGDRLGCGPTAGDVDQGIVGAVDDHGRATDCGQRLGPVTRADRGNELALAAGRVDAALVVPGSDRPQPELVELEAWRADHPARRDQVVEIGVEALRRAGHQHLERRLAWLADRGRAGGGHQRSQRAHPFGALDRQRLGDEAAERGADQVCGIDPEPVEQPGGVGGHVGEQVGRVVELAGVGGPQRRRARRVEPGRAAAVAVVEANHVQALGCEQLAEAVGPGEHLRTEAHDQEQWRVAAVAKRLVAELDLPIDGDEGLLGPEPRH